jgi:hypothetical protein
MKMPGKKGPKAESKAQQAVAGMAHAIQKGEMKAKPGTPSAEMAKSMDPADAKSMASTKHKGLPRHTPTGNLSKKKF